MLELCRYIHRNPLDDQIVEKIEDWEFSNYPEWIGKRNASLIDLNFIRKHFPEVNSYEKFVKDFLSDKQARNELRKYLFEIKCKKQTL